LGIVCQDIPDKVCCFLIALHLPSPKYYAYEGYTPPSHKCKAHS
jgi:hypothetical protein